MSDLRAIIDRLNAGEATFDEDLLPIVYDELRALASRQLAKEGMNSLQTTELVHEAYLRLVGHKQQWEGQVHFFNAAAEAMRRILVDRRVGEKAKSEVEITSESRCAIPRWKPENHPSKSWKSTICSIGSRKCTRSKPPWRNCAISPASA